MRNLFIISILFFQLKNASAQQKDSLVIESALSIQFDSLHLIRHYTRIPANDLTGQKLGFNCRIKNNTSDTIRGLISRVALTQLEDVDGNIINQTVFEEYDSSNWNTSLLADSGIETSFDSVIVDSIYCGKYQLTYYSYSKDTLFVDTFSYHFIASDSIWAKDRDVFNNSIKFSDFQDTGTSILPINYEAVKVLGELFYVDRYSGDFYSLSIKVSNDSANIGTQVLGAIYEVDPTKLDSNNVAADQSPLYSAQRIINGKDLGEWISFSPDSFGGNSYVGNYLPEGYYLFVWEEIWTPSGKEFSIQNDTSDLFSKEQNSTYVQFYDPYVTKTGTGWVSVQAQPAVRFNTGFYKLVNGHGGNWSYYCYRQPVGIEENKLEYIKDRITVFPNPTSGFFNIGFSSERAIKSIQLYNLLGKEQQIDKIKEEDNNYEIDFVNQPAGIYILQIQFNDGSKISKKVVKQ